MPKYTADELRELPTLATGQSDDLKIEDLEVGVRIWLARTDVTDGEPYNDRIHVETRSAEGNWEITEEYPG